MSKIAPDGQPPPVGVVLVHGIGKQRPNDTRDRFLRDLQRVLPLEEIRQSEERLQARLGAQRLHIYEAYWADLLEGENVSGTFNFFDFQGLAWFPLLNLRAGLYKQPRRLAAFGWTLVLAPVAFSSQILYYFFSAVIAALGTQRSLNQILDETAADVTNYASSAGGATRPNSKVEGTASQILERFYEATEKAANDGCKETYVVAHSLGTVITFHALSGLGDISLGNQTRLKDLLAGVTHLYTIGSPLEKMLLLWPRLFETQPSFENLSYDWHNFYDPLDPISSPLHHFDAREGLTNYRLFGRAGFLSAHTTYGQNPTFLRSIGEGIFGSPVHISVSLWERLRLLVRSLGESLILPVAILLIMAITLALGWAVAKGLGFFIGVMTVFENAGMIPQEQWGHYVDVGADIVFIVYFWVLFLFGPLLYGRVKAKIVHTAHRYRRWPVEAEELLGMSSEASPPKPDPPTEADEALHQPTKWSLPKRIALACFLLAGSGIGAAIVDYPDQEPIWGRAVILLFASLFGCILLALPLGILYIIGLFLIMTGNLWRALGAAILIVGAGLIIQRAIFVLPWAATYESGRVITWVDSIFLWFMTLMAGITAVCAVGAVVVCTGMLGLGIVKGFRLYRNWRKATGPPPD